MDPWGSLPHLLCKFQINERPCLKKRRKKNGRGQHWRKNTQPPHAHAEREKKTNELHCQSDPFSDMTRHKFQVENKKNSQNALFAAELHIPL